MKRLSRVNTEFESQSHWIWTSFCKCAQNLHGNCILVPCSIVWVCVGWVGWSIIVFVISPLQRITLGVVDAIYFFSPSPFKFYQVRLLVSLEKTVPCNGWLNAVTFRINHLSLAWSCKTIVVMLREGVLFQQTIFEMCQVKYLSHLGQSWGLFLTALFLLWSSHLQNA